MTRELRAGDALVFSVAHAPRVGYLLTMPVYGRFLVAHDGLRVLCAPTDAPDWAAALVAQVLPLACTLRGFEPFHASAVVLDGAALMMAGPVTAGKSTLAARLVEGGAQLVSDDVVAIEAADGELWAHPGGRWLRLRAPETVPAASRLTAEGGEEGRTRYAAPVVDGPHRLRAVYLLGPSSPGPAIAPVPDPGPALLGATYNLSVRDPQRLRRQLDVAHHVAQRAPVFRVARRGSPGRVAAVLREHFESSVLRGAVP